MMEQNHGDPDVLRCWEERTSGAETAHVEGESHAGATSGNVDISDILKWAQMLKSRAWISTRLLSCDQNG